MDQDSFRSLLNASKAPSGGNVAKSKAYNRGSLLASGSSNAKPSETPQTAFKPRKVKKATDSKYRDRASERREGVNDYAAVEGILQDFEKRMEGEDKQVVEEQRKYLGGDATHTVLVKGLDFALLEQTRAQQDARDDIDDDLESAFHDKPSDNPPPSSDQPPAQGKKRTRAELLAELQRSREANLSPDAQQALKASTRQEEIDALERAKQAGKFKPMGSSSFAPVEKKKKKKKKVVVEGQDKPKESATKVAGSADTVSGKQGSTPGETPTQPGPSVKTATTDTPAPNPTPTPVPAQPDEDIEDADPFADAGEYEPDFGDDSDAERDDKPKTDSSSAPVSQPATSGKRNWFNDPDPEPEPAPAPTKPATPPPNTSEPTQDTEPSGSMRLEGFASSAMPSISEFLAMDKAEEEREKKRARKEKKKKAA